MVFKKDFLDKIINITSNAAIACYPHLGKKDKILVDKAATDEMRKNLNDLDINGKEVIIATNATTEGQITGQYIADECSKFQILITRLAQGIPIGGELDLLDYNTMSTAFTSRSEIKKIS